MAFANIIRNIRSADCLRHQGPALTVAKHLYAIPSPCSARALAQVLPLLDLDLGPEAYRYTPIQRSWQGGDGSETNRRNFQRGRSSALPAISERVS